ncbi:hypothetical protein [Alistipes sp.]|uniref:hypothetical protein n=1 Tax=Alistipes sp. TaxID=1872444 RepID=UPI003AEF3DCE
MKYTLGVLLLATVACVHPLLAQPFSAQSAVAQPATPQPDRAGEIVRQLASAFRAMPSYGVGFEVLAGEYATRGRYAVAGDRYSLALGDAEVFSDAAVRYEVDNRRREITVNPVDTAARNILSNPVRAFDFLDSQYTSELLWERDGLASVRLTPAPGSDASAGTVTVTLSLDPLRPLSLAYDFDGEQVTVRIRSVEPLAEPVRSFDRAAYPGYELIDFR